MLPGSRLEINVLEISDSKEYEKELSSYRSSRRRHLYLGLLSAAGTATFYLLERMAYDDYMDAVTLSGIEDNYDTARRYRIAVLSLGGVSGYSWSRYFFAREPERSERERIVVRQE